MTWPYHVIYFRDFTCRTNYRICLSPPTHYIEKFILASGRYSVPNFTDHSEVQCVFLSFSWRLIAYYTETYHDLLPTIHSSLMNIFPYYSIIETSAVEIALLNKRRRYLSNIWGNTTTFKNSLLAEQVRAASSMSQNLWAGPRFKWNQFGLLKQI
jgi:hypothetical protein